MTRLMINGVNGAMGQTLAGLAQASGLWEVVCGIDKLPDAFPNPFPVFSDINECDVKADVLADFSRPEALDALLGYCVSRKLPMVIATTGFSPQHEARIHEAAKSLGIFKTANFSLGINLMVDLIKKSAAFLGDGFDIEIIEKHHNRKIDSPSGTALMLANALNASFDEPKDLVYGRHSQVVRREPNEITLHAVRGGTVVGEHDVLFLGNQEEITIHHAIHSRQVFAAGVLRAAQFMADKTSGLYTMEEMIRQDDSATHLRVDRSQALVTLHGIPYRSEFVASLFRTLSVSNISVDIITQSAPLRDRVDISFTLEQAVLNQAIEVLTPLLAGIGATHESQGAIVKLTLEGRGMEHQAGVASRVFDAFAQAGVTVLSISTSESKISLCIDQRHAIYAVDAIRGAFGKELTIA